MSDSDWDAGFDAGWDAGFAVASDWSTGFDAGFDAGYAAARKEYERKLLNRDCLKGLRQLPPTTQA